MGLFSKRTPPDRADSPARKATPQSTDDWMASMASAHTASPAGQAESAASEKKEAMRKWHSNNTSVRNKLNSDAESKRMDDSHAESKRAHQQTRNQGNMVTSENGRAIDTGRM